MGLLKEFRTFAMKGNVIDMAVGIIIGAAFSGTVKSLVDDVMMPVIGIASNADFSNFYVGLNSETRTKIAEMSQGGVTPSLAEARKLGPVLAYGNFITVAINFVIVAFCVFLLVKAVNTAKQRFEEKQIAAPEEAPPDVKLLTEIRDLLKEGRAA